MGSDPFGPGQGVGRDEILQRCRLFGPFGHSLSMTKGSRPTGRCPLGLSALLAVLGALAWAPPAAAQSASAGNVTIRLTVPEGVSKIKGVLTFTVRGIASGWARGEPMIGLAKRLSAAIATVSGGDDLNDNSYPRRCQSGEFENIPNAFKKLAEMSNHPELANVPLVGIGHSHGGDYWNWFTACHPERMAVVFVHASGGVNYNAAALKTPVLYELGTRDLIENGSKKPRAGMFANRGKGAPMGLVIGEGEGHNDVSAASLAMIIDLIEALFKLRVPADADGAKGPVILNEIDEASGTFWVGDLYTKEIARYSDFKGNKAHTAFLPNEAIAQEWKMAGPGLPTSIELPSGTCGWCGDPNDEPKETLGGKPVTAEGVAAPAVDAGADPPAAPDAAPADPPGGAATPPPSTPPAQPPPGGDAKPDPGPQGGNQGGNQDPEPKPATRDAVTGGCTMGARSPAAGLPWILLLGALALALGRLRRASPPGA